MKQHEKVLLINVDELGKVVSVSTNCEALEDINVIVADTNCEGISENVTYNHNGTTAYYYDLVSFMDYDATAYASKVSHLGSFEITESSSIISADNRIQVDGLDVQFEESERSLQNQLHTNLLNYQETLME